MPNEDAIVTYKKNGKIITEKWVLIDTPGFKINNKFYII
jgi:hypothetical protein